MSTEELVGYTSPSQWVNVPMLVGVTIFSLFGIWGDAPILSITMIVPIIRMIDFHYWRYEFGELTIQERKGVFTVTRMEMSYYRIKSIKVEEPFWFRFFNLGNVTIISSDPMMPNLMLYAIRNPNKTRDVLREVVKAHRKEEGVREFDTYDLKK